MGWSVSGAGDVNGDGYADVIVGAYGYGNPVPADNEGAFFVYHGAASGINTVADTMVESNLTSAVLGFSVSGAGDVNGDGYADVIVGAQGYDNGQNDEGAFFVYHGSASGINTTAAAMDESDQTNAFLGHSVSGAGDVNGDGYADVIVGAYFYDSGQNDEGAAFVYLGADTGIDTTAAFMVESDQVSAYMGFSVSGAGDVNGDGYADVIVGAQRYDNGQNDEGAAFVYHGSASGIDTTTASMVESDQANAYLGFSVSGAGDVNGDGYGDVIVGVYGYDNGQNDEGAAFVYHGSAAGINTTADAMVESDQASANLGVSVSGAGDVNGDGYADVIVGAYFYDNGQNNEGAFFVYHGSASGINTVADTMVESDQADAWMGWSVSGAGDVNGDGYADVIVGAYGYGNPVPADNEGAFFVYHGTASGINTVADTMVESNLAGAVLGFSVSGAGDVNGDGYADVIVGAQGYDNGQNDEGAFFVYHGSATGITTTAAAMDESDQTNAFLGHSVSGAGDVNGDGYADVIVGAHGYGNPVPASYEGAFFVYHGSASGISTTADAMVESNQANAQLGWSLSGAGDVNGDGYTDVIVGAYNYDNGQNDEGAAFVYHGSAAGLNTTAAAMVEPDQVNARLGQSGSGAGDVNGDGYADVIVGAYFYDSGQNDEGAAYVYYGNSEGRTVMARQLRGNGGTETVAPWGGSYDPDGFQVRIQATSPKGREQVKMQVEYCPSGVPFDDPSCSTHTSSDWTEVSGSGVILTEAIASLNLGERYRWRARILYAPFTVTEAGITEPPNPEHGPWRRGEAQSEEADILVDGALAASGNSNNSGGGGCFITVAASGSQLEPHVMALREFQNGYLLNNSPGKINAALGFFLALVIAGLVISSEKLRGRRFKA
jgi:sorbitol-specific phosphotransferase system component IIC